MTHTITVCGPNDASLFTRIAEGVFDHSIRKDNLEAFLIDPRHHIAVAVEDGIVVGMCTANQYLHPDKPVQAWINELGVAPSHRRRGIGRELLRAMLGVLRDRAIPEVWIATEHDNAGARAVYRSVDARETEGIVMYEITLPIDEPSAQ